MSDLRPFLFDGESIGEEQVFCDPVWSVDYSIWSVKPSNPALGPKDRALIEVRDKTPPLVVIGGNPLYVDVLRGSCRLNMIDLENGSKTTELYNPDGNFEVPPHNMLYWYERIGPRPTLLRDTSLGFEPKNEPSLEKVVQELFKLF